MALVGPGHVQLFVPAAGSPLQWRLLSRNNREIGRSALEFADEQSCRAAIAELQAALDDLAGDVRSVSNKEWSWVLSRGEQALATSGRTYGRVARCAQAMDVFIRAIRGAVIMNGVLVSDSRRWEPRAVGPASPPHIIRSAP